MNKEEKLKKHEDATHRISKGDEVVECHDSLYHFSKMMESMGRDFSGFNELVFDFQKFISMWDAYQERGLIEESKSDYEKKMSSHLLAHTIKPRTKYANQQEKRNGKPILYPIYYFREDGRLESGALGCNYPVKDCNIYVKNNRGTYIKIK